MLLKYFIVCFLLLGYYTSSAQRLLQLERWNDPVTIKFFEGDKIYIKTIDFPGEWQSVKIENINPEENFLMYKGGFMHVSDITDIRIYRSWAKHLGEKLIIFGVGWLSYGGVAAAFLGFDFGWDTLAIGGSAIGLGWLIKKLFAKHDYKLGKKHRLRMLDLRFPSAEEMAPSLRN